MEKQRPAIIKYAICVGIELLIGFLVIWSKGFFVHSPAVNLQILADAFFVPGVLTTLFAGLLYVSGEGALIGIGLAWLVYEVAPHIVGWIAALYTHGGTP